MQVQVGSFANLVDISGLHASAVKNRIASGSASQLRTNYLLDDDSIMEIDPSSISWSFDSPDLQFQENSLFAQYVDKRRTVRVRASGMGFESSFTVFILPVQIIKRLNCCGATIAISAKIFHIKTGSD